MNFGTNHSPKTYSISAVVVGYLLIDDLSAIEQNALGNWLMLVAQVLCTNAYFKELQSQSNINNLDDVKIFKKMSDILNNELDKIKKST